MNETGHSQPELFELPHEAPPFEYVLLKGHERTDGSFKDDEQLRTEYVHLTDNLIYKMTHGISVEDPETGERVIRKPDVVIWLDKSARPVSWLTKELWDTFSPDEDGTVPKMPDFRYVNIDREQWVNQIDPQGSGYLDINEVNQSIIRSLRSVFTDPIHKKQGLTEAIDSAPTELDKKTILIVDEVRASGRTLDIAKKFFQKAFPDTAVGTAHWMSGLVQKNGAIGNRDVPVWYKDKDVSGRGVGNRDELLSKRSKSRTQRLGAWFLSTRLAEDDTDSKRYREELHQLGQDVKDKKVLVIPSADREIDDIVERAERLNGIDFEDYKAKRQSLLK
jgi:hypoxanthine-guanine phosphoribosyltransferase